MITWIDIYSHSSDLQLICVYFLNVIQISFLSFRIFTYRARISYTFTMTLQDTYCSCSFFTYRTRISHFFVLLSTCSFRSLPLLATHSRLTHCICSISTFKTGKSNSFMYIVYFQNGFQVTCCNCSIITLSTRISHFFVLTFNMNLQEISSGCN